MSHAILPAVHIMAPWVSLPPQVVGADTVYMVAVRDGLGVAADVAVLIVGVFVLVLLAVLLLLIGQIRALGRSVKGVGDRVVARAGPIFDRGRDVADNVEFISSVVRKDVERLNETVRALTERLRQASELMEERISDFNALVEVVQEEAEDLFIDTASTARGVKRGVTSLTAEDADQRAVSTTVETADEEAVD